MRYAVDSTGEIIRLSEADGISQLSQETRVEELNKFIIEFFGDNNRDFYLVIPSAESCADMTMPNPIERILLFTRTQLSSSSRDVRLANELEHHPEINGEECERLQSVFSLPADNSVNVANWYRLDVGYIEFERNMCDFKYINICYVSPVPYARFMKQLDTELADFQLLNAGLELAYPKALLKKAFDRDSTMPDGSQYSQFDSEIRQSLERYKQANGYDRRDKDSNKANNCIAAITEYNENCFPVYQQVKNCIKKTFKGAYNIRYKGNCITAQLDDSHNDTTSQGDCSSGARMRRTRDSHTLALYVVKNDPVVLIVGGNTVYGIDALKDALTSTGLGEFTPILFEETEWFTEKVKPVVDGVIN